MKWLDLQNKTVGIWGMGREGLAVVQAVNRFVPSATVLSFDDNNLTVLNNCDIVITSPGVSLYRPEIQQAQKQGIIFTTGTDLFLHNKSEQTKVIGVTGTKGKSTTSSLLYHTLVQCGFTVKLAGNIGIPLIEMLFDEPDIVVAELSSYQCAGLTKGCDIAVLLNLYPEHLQWHLSHHNYYQDKCKLIQLSEQAVINGSNETILSELINVQNLHQFNTFNTIHLEKGLFFDNDTALFAIDFLNLKGEHNALNACAVLTVLKLFNQTITDKVIQSAFQTMNALPHRLQNVGTFNGLTFIDDSISTTPESAIAALKAYDNGGYLTLLVGGYDRGQIYEPLIDYARTLKNRILFITLPDTGTRIAQMAEQADIQAYSANSMQEAVKMAQQQTPMGGKVILSPAAPSYNLYQNFEERGKDFENCIQKNKENNLN